MPFDTYKLATLFLNIGFTKPQSEALVETVHKLDTAIAMNARAADDIKTDIKVIRADLAEIKSGQTNIPYWITGALFAQGGLVVAILQLLRS